MEIRKFTRDGNVRPQNQLVTVKGLSFQSCLKILQDVLSNSELNTSAITAVG